MAEVFSEIPFPIVEERWTFALDWTEIAETAQFTVNFGATATVTNATNATPIVVTTSAAHGFVTGDHVDISGVTGNLAANGHHQITFVSATQFSLNNSVGDGAYAGGGTAQRGVVSEARSTVVGMVRIQQLAEPWNPCSATGVTPSTGGARRVIY